MSVIFSWMYSQLTSEPRLLILNSSICLYVQTIIYISSLFPAFLLFGPYVIALYFCSELES